MARSDLMKFWKLLTDTGFTGSPSKITEGELQQLGRAAGLPEPEIEAALRGLREFRKETEPRQG